MAFSNQSTRDKHSLESQYQTLPIYLNISSIFCRLESVDGIDGNPIQDTFSQTQSIVSTDGVDVEDKIQPLYHIPLIQPHVTTDSVTVWLQLYCPCPNLISGRLRMTSTVTTRWLVNWPPQTYLWMMSHVADVCMGNTWKSPDMFLPFAKYSKRMGIEIIYLLPGLQLNSSDLECI